MYVYVCILIHTTERSLFFSVSWLHSWRRASGTWKLASGGHDSSDKKNLKAIQTKLLTEDGPQGALRRRIRITHQCIHALLEGWNTLTRNTKDLQWANGLGRRKRILLSAIFSYQPEADSRVSHEKWPINNVAVLQKCPLLTFYPLQYSFRELCSWTSIHCDSIMYC